MSNWNLKCVRAIGDSARELVGKLSGEFEVAETLAALRDIYTKIAMLANVIELEMKRHKEE